MDNIRQDGGTPSVDSIATELSGMHTTQRAPALLALQQTHGNQYVQRVVTGIQAKLKIGQPGDKYEQEADRVADEVMRMPEPEAQWHAEEQKRIMMKMLVQRQAEGGFQASRNLEGRLAARQGSGRPLPHEVRSFMEARFGADFGVVRVHTDSEAAQMNRELSAQAFTYRSDVYFGAGRYDPSTRAGKRLLAHELTHVLQQGGGQVQRQALAGQIGQHVSVSLHTDGVSIQRVFVQVHGTTNVAYDRRDNTVEIVMPWLVNIRELLDNFYSVLNQVGSSRRNWQNESWHGNFETMLFNFLRQIRHEIAVGHGRHERGTHLSFIINLVTAGGRINRVTLNVSASLENYGVLPSPPSPPPSP